MGSPNDSKDRVSDYSKSNLFDCACGHVRLGEIERGYFKLFMKINYWAFLTKTLMTECIRKGELINTNTTMNTVEYIFKYTFKSAMKDKHKFHVWAVLHYTFKICWGPI